MLKQMWSSFGDDSQSIITEEYLVSSLPHNKIFLLSYFTMWLMYLLHFCFYIKPNTHTHCSVYWNNNRYFTRPCQITWIGFLAPVGFPREAGGSFANGGIWPGLVLVTQTTGLFCVLLPACKFMFLECGLLNKHMETQMALTMMKNPSETLYRQDGGSEVLPCTDRWVGGGAKERRELLIIKQVD